MPKITKLMIKEFKIREYGYDFMGYHLNQGDKLTFHHLVVARRDGGPYARWNGAVLCGASSHPYLHTIEQKDHDIFMYITSEMLDMNIKGYLDMENLKKINDLLCYFEKEHCSDRMKSGKLLIKEEYTRRLTI